MLFNYALKHLTRIHRALRMHKGHVLVIGMNGCGKQCAIKLAAFAAEYEIFEIKLTRGYNLTSFNEDLKILFKAVGIENKKIVFMFTDSHVVDDAFLEVVNNILMTGMVPALFTDDEKDNVVSLCRQQAASSGYGITK